jgi:hypothetical protein
VKLIVSHYRASQAFPPIMDSKVSFPCCHSPNSSVGVGRCRDELRAGRPGFDSRQCKIFLFSTASRPTLGAHPASHSVGTGGSFVEGKAAGE